MVITHREIAQTLLKVLGKKKKRRKSRGRPNTERGVAVCQGGFDWASKRE